MQSIKKHRYTNIFSSPSHSDITSHINFKLFHKILKKNNTVNIFFDKKTYDLVGWRTKDIYQNLAITFISSVKVNQNIDSSIFVLPKN